MTDAFATLAAEPRWVGWRPEPRAEDPTKTTKVPYQPDGRKALSTATRTWRTRAEITAALPNLVNGAGGGIAIVLGDLDNGMMLAGIDLDTCRRDDGTFEPWARQIIDRFATYGEISPSGQGVKLFFFVRREDFELIRDLLGRTKTGRQFKLASDGDHPPGIESYFYGRFFAVTENHLAGTPDALVTIDQEVLRWLLVDAGPALVAKKRKTPGGLDGSRSASAFRIAHRLHRQRKSFEEFAEAARTDPKTASWYREKGIADGARQLHNIWNITGRQLSEADTIVRELYAVVNEAGLAATNRLGIPSAGANGSIASPSAICASSTVSVTAAPRP
jgi:hypothetical protein